MTTKVEDAEFSTNALEFVRVFVASSRPPGSHISHDKQTDVSRLRVTIVT